MTGHELTTDHNGDPRCLCSWAPDPAECGPGISGQLRAAGKITAHARHENTKEHTMTTPTPRDIATGHVDVAALAAAEAAASAESSGETYKAVLTEPVRLERVTLTAKGRQLMAVASAIESELEDTLEAIPTATRALEAAALEVDPADLTKYQDGAVIYYETRSEPVSRNVMVRDRGVWWVAGSTDPVSDVDLTPDYVQTIRDGAKLWLVRA